MNDMYIKENCSPDCYTRNLLHTQIPTIVYFYNNTLFSIRDFFECSMCVPLSLSTCFPFLFRQRPKRGHNYLLGLVADIEQPPLHAVAVAVVLD